MIESNFGYLNIYKPSGPTSHDIVDQMRQITGIKKIGHAGTLDPFAQGVLILGIGRQATKDISRFVKLDKEYMAEIYLGARSDTYDRTGDIKEVKCSELSRNEASTIINGFLGRQKQIPPMYSAKKVKGKKLYELARQGRVVEREPQDIEIYEIQIISFAWPLLKIKVNCSSGTYIRSIANDIGERSGCKAYLKELTRTAIGDYTISGSVLIDRLNSENWRSFLML